MAPFRPLLCNEEPTMKNNSTSTIIRSFTSALTLLALLLLPGFAHAEDKFRDLPESAPLAWMQLDARLQASVVMDISSKPLRIVLEDLSRRTHVTLTAERELGEYRISIHAGAQSLAHSMGKLLDLFGHGKLPNTGYEWQRRGDSKTPSAYYLARNRRAIEEEIALLDMPRQTANRWLKELRDYTRASKEEQSKFSADWPMIQISIRNGHSMLIGDRSPVSEAVKALTDAQLETLQQQGSVDLADLRFSDQARQTLIPSTQNFGVAAFPRRTDFDVPGAVLRLQQDEATDTSGNFSLGVYPHMPASCSISFNLDTQHQLYPFFDTQEMQIPVREKPGKTVDILLHAPKQTTGTPLSMPFESVVALLAKEAQINVYGEMFPRRPVQLDHTTGTPEEILTYACAYAGYCWRRVGGDYLLYSKSWAQDRQANVPQPLLERWLANFARTERYALKDLLEMATLRDEQIKNLIHWMDVQQPLSPRNRNCLRLVQTLSPHDYNFAYGPQGVTLGTLDDAHKAMARKELGNGMIEPLQAFMKREPDLFIGMLGGKPLTRTSLTITLQDGFGNSKSYWIVEPTRSQMPVQQLTP